MKLVSQVQHTYHSPLPDHAHPVLHAGHAVRDLHEVLLAQGSLLDAEWTVLRRHNAQCVTGKNKISPRVAVRGRCGALRAIPMNRGLQRAHTWPEDPWGTRACWGRCAAGGRWRGRRRETSPGGSTASRWVRREPRWSLRGPLCLQRRGEACWCVCVRRAAISLLISYRRRSSHSGAPTLHLSRSNHISCRHAGHIDQVYWTTGLRWQRDIDYSTTHAMHDIRVKILKCLYPVGDGDSSVSSLRLQLQTAKQGDILNRNFYTHS